MKMASSKYKPIGTYLKYHNTKVIYKDIRFSSKKEMRRYITLKQLERAGIIKELELQPKFLLQEGYTNAKGKKIRPIYYIADFYYYDYIDNKWVVEDTKGVRTDVYKLKKKLFEYKYNLTIDEL
jgi:hypothetical protein